MSGFSVLVVLQLVVGLGLLNVWLLRSRSATSYRGGESQTLKEEFHAYGLPDSMFYLVGLLKVGAGVVLVTGVWLALPVQAAAGVVALLMVGAIAMHVKVGDPVGRSVPAALMLIMSAGIVLLA